MSFTHSFIGYKPPVRYDGDPWTQVRIEESATEDGTYAEVETLALSPIDTDPTAPASRSVTTDEASLEQGWFRLIFLDAEDQAAPASTPVYSPATSDTVAFATAAQVATRLGRSLTTLEEAQINGVLEGIAGLMRAEAGKTDDWTPDPIPSALREMSIQKAIAALINPNNVAATSKSLGSFSESLTFQRSQDGGVFLSDEEGRRVRFAIYGTNSASTRARSHVDTALDLIDDGEINASLGS